MISTTRLLIGLGANLTPDGYATPQAGCEAAMVMLGDLGVNVTRMSRWYESAPVPPSDQPWYLNAVAEAVTSFDAAQTLAVMHQVESDFGRVRSVRNAARVLDLDLLDFGGRAIFFGALFAAVKYSKDLAQRALSRLPTAARQRRPRAPRSTLGVSHSAFCRGFSRPQNAGAHARREVL